ncbi:MAG: hypothetical protein MUQ10_15420 [Anaerolineae bacterium]|nr:hypothetical protein [Anaerolineae bacterium]
MWEPEPEPTRRLSNGVSQPVIAEASLGENQNMSCSVCQSIPNRAQASWKGGGLLGEALPRAASILKVVGEPFFNDRDSYSHSCLKQCPKCGTYYDWEFTYEFLVNGTEDDIVLTRLSDEEGKERAKEISATIEVANDKFRSEAKSRVHTLQNSQAAKGIYGAADFLQQGQNRGHNIEFAIDALVKAFVRASDTDGEDSDLDSCSSIIYFVLRDAVKESEDAAREILNILHNQNMTTKDIRRINWLIADCRKILQTGK